MPFDITKAHGIRSPAAKRFKPATIKDMESEVTKAVFGAPPDRVKSSFSWECGFWMSIDVETNKLAPNSEQYWEIGDFGHKRRVVDSTKVGPLRIVQLGCAIGKFDPADQPVVKSVHVKPDGFEIATSATKIHKITTEFAAENGVTIRAALDEFLHDLKATIANNGRICAHNLEFDAKIIYEEMKRANFNVDDIDFFTCAVQNGFCTFNPTLTRWCCEEYLRSISRFSEDDGLLAPVGLKELVRVLDVETQMSIGQFHDAGVDSRATWLVLRELRRLVRGA
jgi:DNA polymerase III epsilon subunit-like protein